MPDLQITRRPIVLETGASAAALTDILGRIEGITGRASLYGITDPVEAKRFAAGSIEADFAGGFYRRGFAGSVSLTALSSWAFARTGLGTAQTMGGGVVSFATGSPRITDAGLLIENASTNHLPYSQALDNAGWSKSGDAVVTADSGGAPDGTVTADWLELGPALGAVAKTAGSNLTTGQPCTFSFWGRGSGLIGLRSGATGAAQVKTLTDQYQRFSMTVTGDALEVFQLANSGLVGGASAVSASAIWGCQVEAGNISSYIPTGAVAATRAKDEASIAVASGSAGGVFVEFDLPAFSGVQTAFAWTDGTTSLSLYRDAAGALTMKLSRPSGDVVKSIAFAGARRVKAFVGFGSGQVFWAVDGGEQASGAYDLPLALTTLKIGQDHTGGAQLDGTVRRVLALDYLPTLAQRIAMTEA